MRVLSLSAVVLSLIVSAGCAPAKSDTNTGASDTAITASVKERFAADAQLKGLPIDVVAQNGVVRLTGAVDTDAVKAEALKVARATDGVTDIIDLITVGAPPATTAAAPEAPKPAAAAAPSADTYFPPDPADNVDGTWDPGAGLPASAKKTPKAEAK